MLTQSNTTAPAHTPGPWRYEAGTKTIRAVPSNYWLATMDSWDGQVDNESNARLIAAAPELLAALKNALNVMAGVATGQLLTINKDSNAISEARAAIAKATTLA